MNDPFATLCRNLHLEFGLSVAAIANLADVPEKHVHMVIDDEFVRALKELQKRQSIQQCGRKIKY